MFFNREPKQSWSDIDVTVFVFFFFILPSFVPLGKKKIQKMLKCVLLFLQLFYVFISDDTGRIQSGQSHSDPQAKI